MASSFPASFGLQGGCERNECGERPPAHLALEVNLIKAGQVSYWHGANETRVERGHVAVFWGATPQRRVYTPDAEVMWLSLSLHQLLACSSMSGFACQFIGGPLLLTQRCHDDEAETFAQWLDDLATGDAFCRRTVAVEVEARLLRVAAEVGLPLPPPRLRLAPEAVHDMLWYLERNYQDESAAHDLAEEVGLTRQQAQTLFRRFCGTSVPGFLQRLRLRHAHELLTNTDHTVLRIAYDAGFASLPRFYEVFKATFGVSPGGYRRRLQEGRA